MKGQRTKYHKKQNKKNLILSIVNSERKIHSSSLNCFPFQSDSDVVEVKEEIINLETCSARNYIEHTVGQILLAALTILERER